MVLLRGWKHDWLYIYLYRCWLLWNFFHLWLYFIQVLDNFVRYLDWLLFKLDVKICFYLIFYHKKSIQINHLELLPRRSQQRRGVKKSHIWFDTIPLICGFISLVNYWFLFVSLSNHSIFIMDTWLDMWRSLFTLIIYLYLVVIYKDWKGENKLKIWGYFRYFLSIEVAYSKKV